MAKSAVDQAAPIALEYAVAEWSAAREKLANAERAYAGRDWRSARELAEQAEVDAKYAQALAENASGQARDEPCRCTRRAAPLCLRGNAAGGAGARAGARRAYEAAQ